MPLDSDSTWLGTSANKLPPNSGILAGGVLAIVLATLLPCRWLSTSATGAFPAAAQEAGKQHRPFRITTVRFEEQAAAGQASSGNRAENRPPPNQGSRSSTPADRRTRWVHSSGSFEMLGTGRWQETLPKQKLRFSETSRNDKYIEIQRAPGVVVRLYDDHCELKLQQDREFKVLYRGTWEPVEAKPGSPAEVADGGSKPSSEPTAPSDAWVHSRGSFRHLEGKRWQETLPDNKLAFVEQRRTDEFIEISRDPGVVVRLYADHCDVKFPEDRAFRLLYRGAWKTTPADPESKPAEPALEVLVRELPVERKDIPHRRPAPAPLTRKEVQRSEEADGELARLLVQTLLRADRHEIQQAYDPSLHDDRDALWVYPSGKLAGKPLARLLDTLQGNRHAVPRLLEALKHRLHAQVESPVNEEEVGRPVQLLGVVGPAAKDAVPQLVAVLSQARQWYERRHRERSGTIDAQSVKKYGLPGLDADDLRRIHEPFDNRDPSTVAACTDCIRTLGRIGPPAAEAVPELGAWLAADWISDERNENERNRSSVFEFTRLEVAIALSRIQPASLPALEALLERFSLWDAYERAGRLGRDESVMDVIKAMQVAPGDALKALAKAIGKAPEDQREWLACIVAKWSAEEAQVAAVLAELTASKDASVREAAAAGQRELAERKMWRELRGGRQANNAAPLLAKLGSFPRAESLEMHQMLSELATQSPAVGDELNRAMGDRSERRRRDAALVMLLMPAPPKNAAQPLLAALSDRSQPIKERAAGALAKLEAAAGYPLAGLRSALTDGRGEYAAYVLAVSGPGDAETIRAMKAAGERFPLLAGYYLSHQKEEREAAIKLLEAGKDKSQSVYIDQFADLVMDRLKAAADGKPPSKVQKLAEQLLLDEIFEYRVTHLSDGEQVERILYACGDATTTVGVLRLWLPAKTDANQIAMSERARAVLAALVAHDESAAQGLLRQAASDQWPTADVALTALGGARLTAASVPALADALKVLANSPAPPESGGTLEQHRKHDNDLQLARQVLLRLADLESDAAQAVPAIEAVIQKQPRLRPQGIETLRWIGRPAAAALVKLLGDSDPLLSEPAGQALVSIAPDAAGVGKDLEQIAATGLKEPSLWAARIMANMGQAGRDRLVKLLSEANPARGVWLVDGLASAGRPVAERLARVALDEEQFDEVRLAAAAKLSALGESPAPAFDLLVKLLESKSLELRQAAAAAIATLREPPPAPEAAVARLVTLLQPPDQRQVREVLAQLDRSRGADPFGGEHRPSDEQRSYVRALGRLGPAARPAVAKLLQWLSCAQDDDVQRTLSDIGPDAAAVQTLFTLLDYDQRRGPAGRILATSDEDVLRQSLPALTQQLKSRQPAARAYAAYLAGRVGEPAKDLVPQLIESLRIDHDAVLMATAFALRQIGAPAAPAAARLQGLLESGQSGEVERELRATLDQLAAPAAKAEQAQQDGRDSPAGQTARFRVIALPSPEAINHDGDSYDPFGLAPTGVRPPIAHVISLTSDGSVMAHSGNDLLLYRDGRWQGIVLKSPDGSQVRGWDCDAINDLGQIAGSVSVSGRTQAFVWRGEREKVVTLPALFEKPDDDRLRDCGVQSLNSRGDAVGWSEIAAKNSDSSSTRRACWWRQDQVQDLGLLPGGENSVALAISDQGLIVGQSEIAGQRNDDGDLPMRACLWKDGKIQDLGVLSGFRDSIAVAVNSSGLIVGRSYTRLNPGETPADYRSVPCAWKERKIISLESFGGADSYASDVNNQGQVVGRSQTAKDIFFPMFQAFLWENGKLLDLNELIPADQKARWTLRDARAINDRGQILAVGQLRKELHNLLLEPVATSGKP